MPRQVLHEIAVLSDPRQLRVELARGADVEAINTVGQTPLHRACQAGLVPAIEILAAAGADLQARDNIQRTPLHMTAVFDQPDSVTCLARMGVALEASDVNHYTALHSACAQGALGVIDALVDAGANIEALTQREHWSPLFAAVRAKRPASIARLAAHGVELDRKDVVAATPLHWACVWGNLYCIAALLEAGADIDACNADGKRAYEIGDDNVRDVLEAWRKRGQSEAELNSVERACTPEL